MFSGSSPDKSDEAAKLALETAERRLKKLSERNAELMHAQTTVLEQKQQIASLQQELQESQQLIETNPVIPLLLLLWMYRACGSPVHSSPTGAGAAAGGP